MKKNLLIKKTELFQGKKHLKHKSNYFEGWYFKITDEKFTMSFIPSICLNEEENYSFIQIITSFASYQIKYDLKEFKFCHEPFYIEIGSNFFSKELIHIDVEEVSQNLKIHGDIKFLDQENIMTNIFNPNIMGPFSFCPFMECNHAILSMKSKLEGNLSIKNKNYNFDLGTGYIEKDWGTSFPKSYIWCQGNNFKNKNASFMLSIADIPFKFFKFKGHICSLIVNNKEYRFATYNFSKICKYKKDTDSVDIILKKRRYKLYIHIQNEEKFNLIAPINGKMEKNIQESISSIIIVTLKKGRKIIFSDISINCGLEIV